MIDSLKVDIKELNSWASNSENRTSSWLCNGLNLLKKVQESLDDLLQLPQTRESMRGHKDLIEKLLNDFLVFIDVYGIFQTLVLKLKEEHSAAQTGARRRDESKLNVSLKLMKTTAKEIGSLVATVQCIGNKISIANVLDPELSGLIKEVIEVTVLVSVAVFNGISVGLGRKKSSWKRLLVKKVKSEESIQEFEEMGCWNMRKMGDEDLKLTLKRMQEVEGCLCGIQIGGERLFRSLINTRVSLLNVLTF